MAKKKGSKVRKKRHLLILEIGGVAVLAALVAGLGSVQKRFFGYKRCSFGRVYGAD